MKNYLAQVLSALGLTPHKFAEDCQQIAETVLIDVINRVDKTGIDDRVRGLMMMEVGIRVAGAFYGTLRDTSGITPEQFAQAVKLYVEQQESKHNLDLNGRANPRGNC